jgi:hypothetical protein
MTKEGRRDKKTTGKRRKIRKVPRGCFVRTSPRVPMGRLAHPWLFSRDTSGGSAFRWGRPSDAYASQGRKRIESFVPPDSGGPTDTTWQI